MAQHSLKGSATLLHYCVRASAEPRGASRCVKACELIKRRVRSAPWTRFRCEHGKTKAMRSKHQPGSSKTRHHPSVTPICLLALPPYIAITRNLKRYLRSLAGSSMVRGTRHSSRSVKRSDSIWLLRRLVALVAARHPPIDQFHRDWHSRMEWPWQRQGGNLSMIRWLCSEYVPGSAVNQRN